MSYFFHISESSLKKKGEELCGDKIKISRKGQKTTLVLSDGLGSGVKANILATLTSEILSTMLDAEVPLEEVIKTALGTLPVCKVRNIAYATFTILEMDQVTHTFKIFNFDNPAPFFFRKGKRKQLESYSETILERKVTVFEGELEKGDYISLISDGVLYAGMGRELNYGWGWDRVGAYTEELLSLHGMEGSSDLARLMMTKIYSLYGGEPGDDATFVGVYVRERHPLMVFTGPPLSPEDDLRCIRQIQNFEGKKILCGGTTANIAAKVLGLPIEPEIASMRRDVPPMGKLKGFDLVTEGILTISKALELLKQTDGDLSRLPEDRNGARLLAEELMQADYVQFLVGQKINEFYQNPLLPSSISIRKTLVKELAEFLTSKRKEVTLEFC